MKEFDYRSDDDSGLIFMSDYDTKEGISQTIEVGDEVTLQIEGEQLIAVVDSFDSASYSGTIQNIIGNIDELKIGESIEFSRSHVWARSR